MTMRYKEVYVNVHHAPTSDQQQHDLNLMETRRSKALELRTLQGRCQPWTQRDHDVIGFTRLLLRAYGTSIPLLGKAGQLWICTHYRRSSSDMAHHR